MYYSYHTKAHDYKRVYRRQSRLLAEMRIKLNMTQKEFGYLLGVGGQYISNIEREISPIPWDMVKDLEILTKVKKGRWFRIILEDIEETLRTYF